MSIACIVSLYCSYLLASLHQINGKRYNSYRELGEGVLGPHWGFWAVVPFQFSVMVGLAVVRASSSIAHTFSTQCQHSMLHLMSNSAHTSAAEAATIATNSHSSILHWASYPVQSTTQAFPHRYYPHRGLLPQCHLIKPHTSSHMPAPCCCRPTWWPQARACRTSTAARATEIAAQCPSLSGCSSLQWRR